MHRHRSPWEVQNLVTVPAIGLTYSSQETLTLNKEKKKKQQPCFTSEINQILKAIWMLYFCLECVAMQLGEASAPSQ